MLVVRDAQLAVLQEQALGRLEDALLAWLTQWWPDRCEALGAAEVRALIRRAAARAAAMGTDDSADVARLVFVTVALGEGFERNPGHPDLAALLADDTLTGPARIARLYERVASGARE